MIIRYVNKVATILWGTQHRKQAFIGSLKVLYDLLFRTVSQITYRCLFQVIQEEISTMFDLNWTWPETKVITVIETNCCINKVFIWREWSDTAFTQKCIRLKNWHAICNYFIHGFNTQSNIFLSCTCKLFLLDVVSTRHFVKSETTHFSSERPRSPHIWEVNY